MCDQGCERKQDDVLVFTASIQDETPLPAKNVLLMLGLPKWNICLETPDALNRDTKGV